jgi:hypothetical protein
MSSIQTPLRPSWGSFLSTARALGLLVLGAATSPHEVQAQTPPSPCSQEEAKQFDFWIGEWTVLTTTGDVAGENRIRKILNGCVLHEEYETPTGYRGESFNIFDATRGVWHQSWVDLGGILLLLEGSFSDGKMVLEGSTLGPDGPVLQRITWNQVDGDPDRVRQFWESSKDGGRSWTVTFDGLYVRK